MAHAAETHPHEACGLVVSAGRKHRLLRGLNISEEPRTTFALDPAVWLEVGDNEAVIGVYHSHCDVPATPSMADRSSCEASGLPWHIVSYPSGGYQRIEPNGFRAPYLKRPYVHAIHDCYAIVRDWYNWEWNLGLPDFERDFQWWEKGQNLYIENFEKCGFVQLVDVPPKAGDAFLIQMHSSVPNHAAIYLGDGTILHHVQGRLSTKDPWGGMWEKHAVCHLRHNSRLGN